MSKPQAPLPTPSEDPASILAATQHKLASSLQARLDALGPENERSQFLQKILDEEKPSEYSFQKAVANTTLFYDIYLPALEQSAKWATTLGEVASGGKQGEATESLHKQWVDHVNAATIPPGIEVDLLWLSPLTPQVTQNDLAEVANEIREKVPTPIEESTLSELLRSTAIRELLEKRHIKAQLLRGTQILHKAGPIRELSTAGWMQHPEVEEPSGALVTKEGRLAAAPFRDAKQLLSAVFRDELGTLQVGGTLRTGFYLKIQNLPEQQPDHKTIIRSMMFRQLKASLEMQYSMQQHQLFRKGDWSFFPKNMEDAL